MTFDWDDFADDNHGLWKLEALKKLRPDFRCTLFAIPGKCSENFIQGLPDWIELAVHGWMHHSVYECLDWSAEYLGHILDEQIIQRYFVRGFKAPGWQISDGCYEELLRRGWWVADQHLEDGRRPPDLPVYFYEDGNYHGHIQDWGSNGLEEDWATVVEAVTNATEFTFASDAARVHSHALNS